MGLPVNPNLSSNRPNWLAIAVAAESAKTVVVGFVKPVRRVADNPKTADFDIEAAFARTRCNFAGHFDLAVESDLVHMRSLNCFAGGNFERVDF